MEWVPVLTLANKITISRLLLIPVFLGFGLGYTRSVTAGSPEEKWRYITVVLFALAAFTDALDGWVARHFNQQSKLGAILDPLADKFLVVSTTALIFFTAWPTSLPLWFVMIVFAKEVFSSIGALVIKTQVGKVKIQPHWTGKAATFLVFITLAFSLLGIAKWHQEIAALAALFACVSGAVYTYQAHRQITQAEHDSTQP